MGILWLLDPTLLLAKSFWVEYAVNRKLTKYEIKALYVFKKKLKNIYIKKNIYTL